MATANAARNHHTVPQFQLRRFARSNKLCVHRRSSTVGIRTVKRTAALDYFYDPRLRAEVDDRVERWLSDRVETPAADAMALLRRGVTLSGVDRQNAATFLSYAIVRGPSFRRTLRQVGVHAGPMEWARAAVKHYRRNHPEFDLSPEEYVALIESLERRAPADIGEGTPAADMRTMVREADRILPRVSAARWGVLEAPARQLLISDSPVVAVHPVAGLAPGPVLWPDGYDLLMPITPKALLVVTEGAGFDTTVLSAAMAALTNRALVGAAHDIVAHHPDMRWPSTLHLGRAQPTIPTPSRTWSRNPDGYVPPRPEWPTIVSDVAREGLELLGGDPPLDDEE